MSGIETFLPSMHVESRRRQRRQDREPLFPQYLFARFDATTLLHVVTFTRGVHSVVRVGGKLATIDQDVVEFFRVRVDEHGVIPLGRKLEPGDRVTIQVGPFADLVGIVERKLPARQRVLVLLTSIGSPMHLEVPADYLRACSRAFAH